MNRNLRATEQRKVIAEELKKLDSHPTAYEIYEIVRAKLPRISLGTVYRNLEILSDSGVIKKLEMAGSQRRFDGTIENHFHVKCLKCGRVADADVPFLKDLLKSLREIDGYKISRSHIEFLGICPQCISGDKSVSQQSNPVDVACSVCKQDVSDYGLMAKQ